MSMIYLILYLIGVVELYLSIIDFKLTQKNRRFLSTLSTILNIYIWYFIGRSLFSDLEVGFWYVTSYALGCGVGCFLGMTTEPFLEKIIIRVQRRGRKYRRGKMLAKNKRKR